MHVVRSATDCQRVDSVSMRNASKVNIEALLDIRSNCRAALRGRKYNVDKTAHVTVSHGSEDQPSLRDFGPECQCTQDWRPGLLSAVPAGLHQLGNDRGQVGICDCEPWIIGETRG
jgi:hypothetical protein